MPEEETCEDCLSIEPPVTVHSGGLGLVFFFSVFPCALSLWFAAMDALGYPGLHDATPAVVAAMAGVAAYELWQRQPWLACDDCGAEVT